MPTLKHLTCSVEWSGSSLPLPEYQTSYADGFVETYIAVPPVPTPFSIHLSSSGYIAPGLAMFVYMDGVYQCNRNRHNLVLPDTGTKRRQTEVNFKVRQKEERKWDGTFEGKQWRFEKVNVVSDPDVEADHHAPHDGEYVGTIEVVVLRCYPAESAKSSKAVGFLDKDTSSSPAGHPEDNEVPLLTGAMFDRSNDRKAVPFGLDGSWDDPPVNKTTAKPSQSNKRRNSRNEFGEKFHNDRDSIGDEALPDRGRSRQPRRTSIPQSPPTLGLRGGGPGSYSVSPAPVSPAHSTKARNNQQPAFSGWGLNRPKQPLSTLPDPGVKATAWQDLGRGPQERNKTGSKNFSTGSYTPEPTTWDNSGPTMPGAWGPVSNLDQGKENHGWNASQNLSGEAKPWDPLSNPTEKRDAWGELMTEPVEETKWDTNVGDAAFDVHKTSPTGNDNEWGTANQDDNDKAGWDTVQDTSDRQNDTWGANGNGTDNPQNEDWHAAGVKDPKNSPALSLGNSNAKVSKKEPTSKEGSVRPKTKSPITFGWMNKNSPQQKSRDLPFNVATSPKRKGSLLGSWSPPLVPKASKESLTVIPESKGAERKVKTLKAGSSSSQVAAPKAKPYWASWNHGPSNERGEEEEDMEIGKAPLAEPLEELIYSLPAQVAQRNRTSHQVRPGRAAAYTHNISTPRYMDSHEDPYAVFVFKYRDTAIIEHMCNTVITEPEAEEKDRLASLTKHELVEELVKAKRKLSLASEMGGSDKLTWKSNPNGTMNEMLDLAAADEKLKTFESTGGNGWIGSNDRANGYPEWGNNDTWNETSNENDNGWGDNNSNNGNANDDSWNNNDDTDRMWYNEDTMNDNAEATAGPGEKKDEDTGWDKVNSGNGSNGWNNDKHADSSRNAKEWKEWGGKDQKTNDNEGSRIGGGGKRGRHGWGKDASGDDKASHNNGSWRADKSDGEGHRWDEGW